MTDPCSAYPCPGCGRDDFRHSLGACKGSVWADAWYCTERCWRLHNKLPIPEALLTKEERLRDVAIKAYDHIQMILDNAPSMDQDARGRLEEVCTNLWEALGTDAR